MHFKRLSLSLLLPLLRGSCITSHHFLLLLLLPPPPPLLLLFLFLLHLRNAIVLPLSSAMLIWWRSW